MSSQAKRALDQLESLITEMVRMASECVRIPSVSGTDGENEAQALMASHMAVGIAQLVDGRTVPVPTSVVRAAAKISYVMRLQPSEPGWLDMALQTPLMDASRARDLLGWEPGHSSTEALAELLDGIGDGAGAASEPLHPRRRARTRVAVLMSGSGLGVGDVYWFGLG